MIGLLKLRIGWVFEMDTETQIYESINESLDEAIAMFEKRGLVGSKWKAESLKEDVEDIIRELKEKGD